MFKKRTGHRDAKCVEGKEDWEVGIPLLSSSDQEEHLSCPSGVRVKAPAENDFGAFCTRRTVFSE